jgi:HEAT repeat protein
MAKSKIPPKVWKSVAESMASLPKTDETLLNQEAASLLMTEIRRRGVDVASFAQIRQILGDPRGQAELVRTLIEWLPRTSNVAVRQEIIRCLGLPGSKGAATTRVLIDEFKRSDTTVLVRWQAASCLAEVQDEFALDEMLTLVTDAQFGIARQMIAVGLGNFRQRTAYSTLVELLSDKDITGHAIMGLARYGDPSAIPSIAPFLTHSKAWVRQEASKAIDLLKRSSP